MSAAHSKSDQCDSSVGTLGELLYADPTKARVSERDWIALVEAIAAGDRHALQALYERTHRLVFTLHVRLTGSWHTAEELTLDVFQDIWRQASEYDVAQGSVLAWVMNQARSRAVDRLMFGETTQRGDAAARGVPASAAEPRRKQPAELREQTVLLERALQALTPEERQVIETAVLCRLAYPEVAVRLNQPLGTIKARIRSALSKLRRALTGETER